MENNSIYFLDINFNNFIPILYKIFIYHILNALFPCLNQTLIGQFRDESREQMPKSIFLAIFGKCHGLENITR